jgi:hypothetical protein
MKKTTISIVFCILLITTTVSAIGTFDGPSKNTKINCLEQLSDIVAINSENRESEMITMEPIAMTNVDGPVEVIDQQQLTDCGWGVSVYSRHWEAQSFTPTLETLTKVRVHFFKSAYHVPSGINLTVHIRSSLTGDDLAILSKDASEIPQESRWVEFDFPDITVIPGNTYYIICEANGGTSLENYCWLFDKNNVYKGGDAWKSNDSGATWSLREDPPDWVGLDYCFITYGLDEPPNIPTIDGRTKGKAGRAYDYDFITLEPDSDKVYYFIDWGDNNNSSWIGPYSSGELITESHTRSKNGTYIIKAKAKDTYGAESDWGTLTVNMPCSYNLPILQFLDKVFDRFPNAFPLLRYLLGFIQ